MKMLMTVSIPHEKFNAEVKAGTAGSTMVMLASGVSTSDLWLI